MTQRPGPAPSIPPRKSGFAHFIAASKYSFAGFRRILRESAFRQELVGGGLALLMLVLFAPSKSRILVYLIAFLLLLAIEALNTALEELVDHLSPQWTEFGKNAKDLGSFAVACTIGAVALAFLWALWGG